MALISSLCASGIHEDHFWGCIALRCNCACHEDAQQNLFANPPTRPTQTVETGQVL